MAEIVKKGVVWDVETTGLENAVDKIIEIGALEFEWIEEVTDDSRLVYPPRIISMYGGLRDPGAPLTDEIKRITGISDKDLAGKSFDQERLQALVQGADLHVAHNMEFDRGFIQKEEFFTAGAMVDTFGPPNWACSIRHIDWGEKGFKSAALNYLAADHGFVNPFPHRALFDCATTFRLMQPHFIELLTNYVQKMFRVYAWRSPFETKDKLREKRYQWDAPQKVWKKDVLESKLEGEREFLAKEIYGHVNNSHEAEALV
ncbi:MAG TPA: 3'-5' exonuclease [Nitrospira sp.]|nr:3'-5' exonuclease [Nitrospira sp.]